MAKAYIQVLCQELRDLIVASREEAIIAREALALIPVEQ